MSKRIAFIGLGLMGTPMASNLVAAGYRVKGYDPTGVYPKNVTPCESTRLAVQDADMVILMVPDGKIVRDVLLGEDGPAPFIDANSLIVDMSSSHPTGTKELGTILRDRGLAFIDAPVSGGVKKAEAGNLAIMVGGDTANFERVKPMLEILGEQIFHVGDLGAGHATKALNNLLSAVGLIASMEVVAAAQKSGIDPRKFLEVINASTGRNNTTEIKMEPHVLNRAFASGFGLSLMVKDITTAMDYAQSFGMDMSACKEAVKIAVEADAELSSGADHTEVAKLVENKAGLKLGKP